MNLRDKLLIMLIVAQSVNLSATAFAQDGIDCFSGNIESRYEWIDKNGNNTLQLTGKNLVFKSSYPDGEESGFTLSRSINGSEVLTYSYQAEAPEMLKAILHLRSIDLYDFDNDSVLEFVCLFESVGNADYRDLTFLIFDDSTYSEVVIHAGYSEVLLRDAMTETESEFYERVPYKYRQVLMKRRTYQQLKDIVEDF
ncbi:MAG: hypothetical protein AB7H80_04080 [Candidatus Kapaibacterium sp.]